MATGWPKKQPIAVRIVKLLLWFIPRGTPDYEDKMYLIKEWLIEFDENGEPWREVGLDENGKPVVSGPDNRNYGFWCDTNMLWEDFDGIKLSEESFESAWRLASPLRHGEVPRASELKK